MKPPGHPEAIGCTCAKIQNNYGKGSGDTDENENPLFYFDPDCILHGGKAPKTKHCFGILKDEPFH